MKRLSIIVILICSIGSIYSQNDTPTEVNNSTNWQFDVTPYLWFSSIEGDISFLSQTIPVEASFKDIWDQLSFAAMLHMEASKGPWTIMADGIYISLSKDGELKRLNQTTELALDETIIEFGGGYRFAQIEDVLMMEALLGGRYFNSNTTLDTQQRNLLDKGFNFTDPYIGVRFKNGDHKFNYSARADVGGFGIGSEVSWKLNLLIGYNVWRHLALYTGYQTFGVDYVDENSSFQYNVNTAGFVFGLNLNF